jgi:2-polyprenyl-6-methoxyphenol hydroxylase-like FAD-dependent oxidoreductase
MRVVTEGNTSMSTEYDIICIGGGLAGATVGLKMAEAGARVLVLESSLQFTDRVRGEWLAPWGVCEARLLGITGLISEAGAHELPTLAGRSLKPRPVTNLAGDTPLTFSHPALQTVLLDHAERAGATVIRGARVTNVTARGLATVEYSGPEGSARVTGRIAIGADGRASLARKALGRHDQRHVSGRLLAGVRLANLSGDPSVGYFILDEEHGSVVSLFPQGGGNARAYVFEPGVDVARYTGAGGFDRFIDAMVRMGVPREAVSRARAAGPLGVFVADDTWVQHPANSALALVGDAAGISDPTWGMGTSLLLRDARVLTELLTSRKDARSALASYARQRDHYYRAIITAERWLSEIQLTPGEQAALRRKAILDLWRREPERAIDLPGRGPENDVSARGRIRAFGEDVLHSAAAPELAVQEPFLAAIQHRDFAVLRGLLADTVRMRMLLPSGPHEVHGAEAATAAFAGWFQDVEYFEPLQASSSFVSDRLRMSWRSRIRWAGESHTRLIEQQAYAKVIDGKVAVLDLLCSGFRVESEQSIALAA